MTPGIYRFGGLGKNTVLAGGPIRVSGGHSKKTLISYLNNNHSYAFIKTFF